EIDPKDVTTRLRIGDLYVRMGKREEAIKEYGEVAKVLTQKGFYLKAIAVYKQILRLDETILDIHYKLAELYSKQGLIADAMAEYGYLVNYYEKRGKIEEVLEILKRMLEIDPSNTGVRLKFADTLYKKGYGKEALAAYDGALKGLMAMGKLHTAERICKDLRSIAHEEPRFLEVMIEINRHRGDNQELLKLYRELIHVYRDRGQDIKGLYEKILEIFPHDEEALEALGKKVEPHREVEEVEELTPFLLEVEEVELIPEPVEELIPEPVIEVMEDKEKEEKAEFHAGEDEYGFSQELDLDEVLDFLTDSWVSTGDEEGGKEVFAEFKKGVERQLSREDSETHYNMGIAYMEMGLYDNAVREFKIALKDPDMEFNCYTRLGLNYMAKGDTQQAVEQFLKGLKISWISREERKGLLYELGLAYEKAGRLQDALEAFRTVMEMDPGFREVSIKVDELSRRPPQEIPRADDLMEIEIL
ncbi:MAG: tetratricopeptide repeat protein, partial [Deltaproteobacteria bacterium]|nr:tetratricopeptide repeat protein [Deltaproteobacteria bacterium]